MINEKYVSVFTTCMKRDIPGYKVGEYADIVINTARGYLTFRDEGDEDSVGTTVPIGIVGMSDTFTRIQDDGKSKYTYWPESSPVFAYDDNKFSNQFDHLIDDYW